MKKSVFFSLSFFLLIILSVKIDTYNLSFLSSKDIAPLNEDSLHKCLGEFTKILSDISQRNADVYFHSGVYDIADDHGMHEHELLEENAHVDDVSQKGSFLERVYDIVKITEHTHLSEKRNKELLPWIQYAIRLNPNNVAAYNTGGYWLIFQMDDPQKGVALLKEGIQKNPQAWQLYVTLGQYYFSAKDFSKSFIFFEQAKGLTKNKNISLQDKRLIYTFLAEIYVHDKKEPQKAVKLYEELLKDFPDEPTLKEKIKKLQNL